MAHQPPKELLNEVRQGAHLEHSDAPVHNEADDALARAQIQAAVKSGHAKDALEHHNVPTHNEADDALARAQIQAAFKSGKPQENLNQVEPPKEGVPESVKQAYLDDQKEKQKQ